MHSRTSQFTDRGLSRRQFGLVLGGGAFLLLAGGTYGVVARSPQHTTPGVATAFGSLTVVRAGRLARLDAQGRTAFKSLAAAASHITEGTGPGSGTQFRRVSTREDLGGAGHGHDAETFEDPAGPEPVNLTWADVVLLEVQLQNAGPQPVLFSPGQLRLKLRSPATTITPQDSDRAPGPLAPHGTEHILISYLAPRDSLDLELEYSDEHQDRTLPLSLPALTANGARP
ncbi:hypothetical protein QFZ69_002540 [Arthrobacter sp. V1I7]|uniref:hypothetical protein n=1 Tax=Arthrobacter sp. V1I7 TaxID=3042274 RepID=UPI002784DA5C|nr:hypothetical protein [Arthrobacter sp. V1I7]MDQ0821661.1 hypothetical protein [Arthrobacter sp. V1I7]